MNCYNEDLMAEDLVTSNLSITLIVVLLSCVHSETGAMCTFFGGAQVQMCSQ